MDKDQVTLLVNGKEYGGWTSSRIGAGIERQARSFELGITTRWPGNVDIARRVQHGDAVEVYAGRDLLVTGYIDATPIKYDGSGKTVTIKGRSKTADLVDCCPTTSQIQWSGSKLEHIAAALAKPYGIKMIAEVNTGPAITNFVLQIGETVFEAIDRMMRQNHVLSTDNEKGDLVFIEVGGAGRCGTALELGKNIREADAPLDYSNVFSRYVCKGQGAGDDAIYGAAAAEMIASVSDPSVARTRVLVLQQTGEVDAGNCRARVQYEQAHRQAKALETVYTVDEWRQQDGTLWLPNKLVRVRDGEVGFDADLLIVGVDWVLDDQGKRTEIRVGPPNGYRPQAAKKVVANWSDVHQ